MTERRKVPINVVLGRHGAEHLGNIDVFKQKIEEQIGRAQQGKVLIVTEDVSNSELFSAVMTLAVDKGLAPTRIAISWTLLQEKSKVPTEEEIEDEKEKYKKRMAPFLAKQYEVIDEIVGTHPKRIKFVPESMPQDDLAKEQEMHDKAEEEAKEAARLAVKGKFSEALPLFKRSTVSHAMRSKTREERTIEKIDSEIQESEDIIGVVVQFGAAHSPIAHELSRRGHEVNTIYPESENGVYIYDPAIALERKIRVFPEREISEEEWLKSLIGKTVNQFFYYIPLGDFTENALAARSWDVMRELKDRESIARFETQVRYYGLIDACLITMGGMSEAEASSIIAALKMRDFRKAFKLGVKKAIDLLKK